jgi:hypothetical protein
MAAFTVIDHTEATGATSSWEKTSIPSSYNHLLLVLSLRSDGSSYQDYWGLQLNSDTTTTKYSYTNLYAYSSTIGSYRATSGTDGFENMVVMPASTATADTFSTQKIWIPNYANTANFKQVLSNGAIENASATQNLVDMTAGLFADTAAITAVKVYNTGSDDVVQYSTFTLYGVTGA